MLRYDRQTKPGLVALYDIWPGNAVGPFLQPRSPHRASSLCSTHIYPIINRQRMEWSCHQYLLQYQLQ